MIHIRVISAENLPVYTKEVRKTRIYCFSSSACRYFYGSFKNKDNTINPKWNGEFDADLLRCSSLSFILFSSRLLSKEVYLGRVDIDIHNFFLQEPGNQILKTPQSLVQCSFPITSCSSSNSFLTLSFSYFPNIYRPIKFQSISSPIIHVFATYTPSVESCPIEIELIQAYYIDEKKNGLNGLFYNFNRLTDWETVGYSSYDRCFLGPSGETQIHTFMPRRLDSKFHFFILNNKTNYEGVVTLNFVVERGGDEEAVKNEVYLTPRKKNVASGTIKTVDVQCHSKNKKICFPIVLSYTKKVLKKDICDFISLPSFFEYDKKDDIDEYPVEYYSNIIEKSKSIIPNWNNVNFKRTNVMSVCNEKISLFKLFSDLNIAACLNLRIYVGGSYTRSSGDNSDTDYWEPFFCVFDKKELAQCPEISKALKNKPYLVSPFFGNQKPLLGMQWNSYVNLNLDQYDINKVFVFMCICDAPLNFADDGFYMISQVYNEVETVLIRNLVFIDTFNSHFVVCFRLEFIEDGWTIIPMRHLFTSNKHMNAQMKILFSNNWVLPDDSINKISIKNLNSSDEELLVETTEI